MLGFHHKTSRKSTPILNSYKKLITRVRKPSPSIRIQYLMGGVEIPLERVKNLGFAFNTYPQESPISLSRGEVYSCVAKHLTKNKYQCLLTHASKAHKRKISLDELKHVLSIDIVKEGGYSAVVRIEVSLTLTNVPIEFGIQIPINLAESQHTIIQDYQNLSNDFNKRPHHVPEIYGFYEEPIEGRHIKKMLGFFVEEWLDVKELHIDEKENGNNFILWKSWRQLPKEAYGYQPLQPATTSSTHKHEVMNRWPILETHIHFREMDNAKLLEETTRIKTIYYDLVNQEAIGMFEINHGDLACKGWDSKPTLFLITHRSKKPRNLYDFFLNDIVFLRACDYQEQQNGTNTPTIVFLCSDTHALLKGFYRGLVENLYSIRHDIDEALIEGKKRTLEITSRFQDSSDVETLKEVTQVVKSIPPHQRIVGDTTFIQVTTSNKQAVLKLFKKAIPMFTEWISSPQTDSEVMESIQR